MPQARRTHSLYGTTNHHCSGPKPSGKAEGTLLDWSPSGEEGSQIAWIRAAFSRKPTRRSPSSMMVSYETVVDTVVDALIYSRDATEPLLEMPSAANNGEAVSSFSRGQQLRDVS